MKGMIEGVIIFAIIVLASLIMCNAISSSPDIEVFYSATEDRCVRVAVDGELCDCSYLKENNILRYTKTWVR